MEKKITKTKLEIGQRYWLDSVKDVSGICISNKVPQLHFNEIEGHNDYITNDDGVVKFAVNRTFTLV